jgi:uncharacterized repeat protein (TIGR03803 family)
MSNSFSRFARRSSWMVLAVVFTVNASAQSNERVLFSFPKSGADGTYAGHPLYLDASGNLFGTADNGGEKNEGTVFELSAPVQGVRKLSVLYSFKNGSDGRNPGGAIVFDASGNLYGAALGGADDDGVTYAECRRNLDPERDLHIRSHVRQRHVSEWTHHRCGGELVRDYV